MGAGPAHAVYFATYEAVKQAMGGNREGHQPLAAGTIDCVYTRAAVLTSKQPPAELALQSPVTHS